MALQNHQHLSNGPRDIRLQVLRFYFLKQTYKHLVLSHIQNRPASKIPSKYIFSQFVSKYVKARRHFKVIPCLKLEGLSQDLDLPDWAFAKLPKLWVCLWSFTNKSKIKLRLQHVSDVPQEKWTLVFSGKVECNKLEAYVVFAYVYCTDAQW